MGVSCTVYTGPVVVVRPPETFEEIKVVQCETCDRRHTGEGGYCSRDGGKFVTTTVVVKMTPSDWVYELEEENDSIDYFCRVPDEGGVEIPDDEVWLTPNQGGLSYCKYMDDPCHGSWGKPKTDPYLLTWIEGDKPVNSPDSMLNEFLADEKAQAAIEAYRKAGAEVEINFVTMVWCS